MEYGVLVHGGDLLKELHAIHHTPFTRKSGKALLRSAAAVVANSQWTREQAQKVLRELGLDPQAERVKVVPLGTDPELFRPGIDAREVRERYRLNGGRWALTVARLESYKGIDTALRAVARVRKEGIDLHYAVVGAGKRAAFRKLAEDLKIADVVRFVGAVPDADLPALYNAAEVYIGGLATGRRDPHRRLRHGARRGGGVRAPGHRRAERRARRSGAGWRDRSRRGSRRRRCASCRRWVACSAISCWRGASGRAGARRSRPTTTGIA